jgi:hypothetical protein
MKHYNAVFLPFFVSCAAVKAELRAKLFKAPVIADPVDPIDVLNKQNAFFADLEVSMSMPMISGSEQSVMSTVSGSEESAMSVPTLAEDVELEQSAFYDMPSMSMLTSMSVEESGEPTTSMVLIMAVDESTLNGWVIPGHVTESISDEPLQALSNATDSISEEQFASPTYSPSAVRTKSNKRTKSPTADATEPTDVQSFASNIVTSVEDASIDGAAVYEVHGKSHKSPSR